MITSDGKESCLARGSKRAKLVKMELKRLIIGKLVRASDLDLEVLLVIESVRLAVDEVYAAHIRGLSLLGSHNLNKQDLLMLVR